MPMIQIYVPAIPDKADLANNREKYCSECDEYVAVLLTVKEYIETSIREIKMSKLNS